MKPLDFRNFPELFSGNYNLRQVVPEDIAEMFILRSDEGVLKYLDIPKAESITEAFEFIKKVNKGISENKWIYWAISLKNENKLVGTICLWNFSDDLTVADIGFVLLPDFQGKGVMQEVVPLILNYGFEQLNLNRIDGEVAPGNIRSIKLLQKFGFVFSRHSGEMNIYSLPGLKYKELSDR